MILTYPFKVAAAVYTYSELEKRRLIDLGVEENKIWIIPPGVDLHRFSNEAVSCRRDNITIGYLGRFSVVKGVHRIVPTLCTILSEEKNVRVVFTGLLEDVQYAKNVISQLKKFKGFQYLSDLTMSPACFYNLCDIILVPSISETGAITVLEAMASGKVVIASDINPINEYIQHQYTGFLFRNQKEAYYHIKRLIENSDLIWEIGKRARKEAEKYDWQKVIRRYEDMYKSVITKNSHKAIS